MPTASSRSRPRSPGCNGRGCRTAIPSRPTTRRLVADLPALTSDGGWRSYFAAAGIGRRRTSSSAQPSYFEGLHKVFDDTPLATWRTYLAFNLLSVFAEYLPAAFVAEDFDFDQHILRGVPENQPRWKRGVGVVDRLMGFALGHLYVDRYFPPANKAHAEALIGNLMAVYAESLATLDWMGDDTRARRSPSSGDPAEDRLSGEVAQLRGLAIRATTWPAT